MGVTGSQDVPDPCQLRIPDGFPFATPHLCAEVTIRCVLVTLDYCA